MGTAKSLVRTVDDHVIDFVVWHRRSLGDRVSPGWIDAQEAQVGIAIALRAMPDIAAMAQTLGHIGTVCGGERGMFSVKARRGWNEAQARRTAGPCRARDDDEGEVA